MTRELSPETSITDLSASIELLDFAKQHSFRNIKEMLLIGFNQLRNFDGFDYRLQREIVTLVAQHHWESILDSAD